ncbi:LamG domain-containing protein [Chloroflexus sp.]|uniref:LamG domain-containing protein n=1 Tax=Chloroflexus sp. TaxID=1904827 RepID=UPI002ADDBFDA|nr:LamG domain-containing protein [Chloroflexus sp.]
MEYCTSQQWYQTVAKLTLSGLLVTFIAFSTLRTSSPTQAQGGYSLRFYGSGTNDRDRVKIPLGPIDANGRITDSYPINVGDTYTIEFWMKATAAENTAPACPGGWYTGNILLDRDVFGAGDYGDYGVAICNQRLVVGVSVGADDRLLTGNRVVTDGIWHHIAITRSASGQIRLFVDGQLDGTLSGASGRIDYRLNRTTAYPTSDPYLVLGAEKHDVPGSLHYTGWIDDLRVSQIARYTDTFTRPSTPHPLDPETIALYRFDEGTGTLIGDSSPRGTSSGELKPRPGGVAQHWSTDTPFSGGLVPTSTTTASITPTVMASSTPGSTYTATPTATPTGTRTATPTGTHTATPTGTHIVTATPSTTPSIDNAPTPQIQIYIPLITRSSSKSSSLR